jgi:hypothetical protein
MRRNEVNGLLKLTEIVEDGKLINSLKSDVAYWSKIISPKQGKKHHKNKLK